MNIEDVARDSPDAIKTLPINIEKGVSREQCLKFAQTVGFEDLSDQAADMMIKLYGTIILLVPMILVLNISFLNQLTAQST